MNTLAEHPTVRRWTDRPPPPPAPLDTAWPRELCLAAGADDAGFVSLARPELDDQRADVFPAEREGNSLFLLPGQIGLPSLP